MRSNCWRWICAWLVNCIFAAAACAAADPATEARCSQYAQRALDLKKEMSDDEGCSMLESPLWQQDYQTNYKACLNVPPQLVDQMQKFRESQLQGCRTGKHKSAPVTAAASPVSHPEPVAAPPAPTQPANSQPHYTYKYFVGGGDTVAGLQVANFQGISMNDAGDVAYVAQTSLGSTLILNDKVIAHSGDEMSGRHVLSVTNPKVSSSKTPSVVYVVVHDSPKECPKCMRSGVAVDHELKLVGGEKVSGCGPGLMTSVDGAAINESGSYVAQATMSDAMQCWVRDGKVVAFSGHNGNLKGGKIGNVTTDLLTQSNGVSLTRDGNIAFRAAAVGTQAYYVCTLKECVLPEPGARCVSGQLVMNDNGQMIWKCWNVLYRGDTYARYQGLFSRADVPFYEMNDRGEIFDGMQLFQFDDTEPKVHITGNQTIGVRPLEDFPKEGLPNFPAPNGVILAGGYALNNSGQIAIVVTAYHPDHPARRAIVIATPTGT